MFWRILTLGLLLCTTGCATVINGTTQNVAVSTTPAGAKITAVGGDRNSECTAPCTLTLKRKYDYNVSIDHEGYKPQTHQIKSVLSGAVAGNILLGGLIGWGVDSASGGSSRLVPEAISATLEEDKKQAPQPQLADNISQQPAARASELEEELSRITRMKDEGKISAKEEQSLRKKALERY